MAPSAKTLFAQLADLERDLKVLSQAVSKDEDARLKLLDILQKSVGCVETPWEVISRMYMEVRPCVPVAEFKV